jgi:hypothetical protein
MSSTDCVAVQVVEATPIVTAPDVVFAAVFSIPSRKMCVLTGTTRPAFAMFMTLFPSIGDSYVDRSRLYVHVMPGVV